MSVKLLYYRSHITEFTDKKKRYENEKKPRIFSNNTTIIETNGYESKDQIQKLFQNKLPIGWLKKKCYYIQNLHT